MASKKKKFCKIQFNRFGKNGECYAEAELPVTKKVIRNIRISMKDNEACCEIPSSLDGKWYFKEMTWEEVSCQVISEYNQMRSCFGEGKKIFTQSSNNQHDSYYTDTKPNNNSVPKENNERTSYGRVKNAVHSDFVFYPHSMLRSDKDNTEEKETKSLSMLATALSKGTQGGIGPFEINALWWTSKLRYVTSTMLLELAVHGFISLGWRESVSLTKLANIANRMCEYNMIARSRFYSVDENGNKDESTKSVSTILTLAPNGGTLLRELGKITNRYNPFTVLQDGNTVKRYLVANQWLIYWLKVYKEKIGENYDSAMLLQRKGEEFSMARTYASVTIDNITMVGEPVRRVDEFEVKENRITLTDKISRMIKIFDHPDQIYCFDSKIKYPSRPIIVLLCEDDEHIRYVAEILSELMNENPEQEFWFSTDLRVFNMNNIGKRFLKLKDGEPEIIDLADYFGTDEEIEKQKLIGDNPETDIFDGSDELSDEDKDSFNSL